MTQLQLADRVREMTASPTASLNARTTDSETDKKGDHPRDRK